MTMRRCSWAEGDAQMTAYHDAEWGVPVHDSRLLWEMLVLEGFQAGLSWRTILHRRDGFRSAFDQFDPAVVARYDQAKIEALMADARIIRARAKIEAAIGGARIYVAMQEAGEDFSAWLWGLAGGAPVRNDGIHVPASSPTSEAISRALKARGFKFVGPTIAYAWMQAVGMINDHAPYCFRRDQVSAA
ncbi:DNA-3-methyladenine glycosylase I [Sphingomonas sp.]|uniref:DNA-3-methyladenine glycosylase I n=1 Tax=Sphingomonas sp. TaxID=28214 RepID=UPI003B3A2166